MGFYTVIKLSPIAGKRTRTDGFTTSGSADEKRPGCGREGAVRSRPGLKGLEREMGAPYKVSLGLEVRVLCFPFKDPKQGMPSFPWGP